MQSIILEGLPASGKTTLTGLICEHLGYQKVNESLGKLSTLLDTDDQGYIFNDTLKKYQLARTRSAVIDRGYPSILAWDYCAERLGYVFNLKEKQGWVTDALASGTLYEPSLYVYLYCSPELSLIRRKRDVTRKDVWSSDAGLNYCSEYYENFFSNSTAQVLRIDATLPPLQALEMVMKHLDDKK